MYDLFVLHICYFPGLILSTGRVKDQQQQQQQQQQRSSSSNGSSTPVTPMSAANSLQFNQVYLQLLLVSFQ